MPLSPVDLTLTTRRDVTGNWVRSGLTTLGICMGVDVVAGLAAAQSSLQQVEAAERETFNARRQLEADQARGDVDLFQLITQEDVLVNAQTNELAARIAFLNTMATLDQTVGITIERWAGEVELEPEWGSDGFGE
ncbi:TolC family protein [Nodosilinea sp. LEGE 07088]|uniref:TolC family protein n=1 Tax=Nodosilinea sp. LEGE 07088 TaxID=2777968 RepID=UPI0018807D68|nr:TolC family protein [Nodosilinea sp. LEGE 07088]MBE9138779.1 TolC family protein [Nodosilinea sp. LEGE 07088]